MTSNSTFVEDEIELVIEESAARVSSISMLGKVVPPEFSPEELEKQKLEFFKRGMKIYFCKDGESGIEKINSLRHYMTKEVSEVKEIKRVHLNNLSKRKKNY